jgi:diadenylate cyclase
MTELFDLYVRNIRLSDGVDILILWFVAYQALLLVRGTRAFQTMLGLLGAGLLYALAQQFELYATHWLLEKLFGTFVLAMLILFQGDIKRGLAGAGGRLFRGFSQTTDASAFEDIIRASFLMASRRIGALIAIEREATLQEYADTGNRLDARLSEALLLSIFHPTSPLHDGAVVVERGRIVAAKVFLPLSLSKDISRFVGTRHRAAIGLTEETDAVVIVVSEERGTVGVAIAGEVRPANDPNELRQRLLEAFEAQKREAKA